jgi:8-oxo-dGTP diphosphatase
MDDNLPNFIIDVQEIKVAVDILVFAYYQNELYTLLIERKYEPFADQWAIPGGFFANDEDLEVAALRELEEETSLTKPGFIKQVGAFGGVERDPRRRIISVTYLALSQTKPELKADTDAKNAKWWNIKEIPSPLAFDHDMIYAQTMQLLRDQLRYSNSAKCILPDEFSRAEIQHLYELVLQTEFKQSRFDQYLNDGEFIRVLPDGKYRFK